MNTIYTIGYTGWHPPDLAAAVASRNAVLVDVRYSPWSRAAVWQQPSLIQLVGAGNYLECREFGNVNYGNGRPIQLADPEAGLAKVAPILAERSVVLLCGCSQVQHCHRRIVAEFLSERLGLPVEHLEARVHSPKQARQWPAIMGLSLWQPWATLMALGAKSYETRSWSTEYRGPLLIAATQRFPAEAQQLCLRNPFKEVLAEGGYWSLKNLPLGKAVAVVNLLDCIPTDSPDLLDLGMRELSFGDYTAGRYAWKTALVQRLEPPVPISGAQQLWPVQQDVMDELKRRGAING